MDEQKIWPLSKNSYGDKHLHRYTEHKRGKSACDRLEVWLVHLGGEGARHVIVVKENSNAVLS